MPTWIAANVAKHSALGERFIMWRNCSQWESEWEIARRRRAGSETFLGSVDSDRLDNTCVGMLCRNCFILGLLSERVAVGSGREFLGSYRMIRLIRGGATCQVWEALVDSDRSRVALKLLQPEVRANRREVNYLKHEYEVGKQLRHENVIEIREFNMDRGLAFLVMEFHSGKNIKMLIRQGIDSFAYVTPTIIRTAAQGLRYLHQQGWVHLDVKPDNFLVDDKGDTKLIDFALAQRKRTGLSKLFSARSRVQGTRSYMSPEQIRGKPPDPRSDIYSFGCMLYELVGGRMPFTGTNPSDLLKKHLYAGVPPLQAANRNVTPEFNDLVSEMMAKDPQERPQSMDEILRRLSSLRTYRVLPRHPTEKEEVDN
jgi:serine/threonine protein kinase